MGLHTTGKLGQSSFFIFSPLTEWSLTTSGCGGTQTGILFQKSLKSQTYPTVRIWHGFPWQEKYHVTAEANIHHLKGDYFWIWRAFLRCNSRWTRRIYGLMHRWHLILKSVIISICRSCQYWNFMPFHCSPMFSSTLWSTDFDLITQCLCGNFWISNKLIYASQILCSYDVKIWHKTSKFDVGHRIVLEMTILSHPWAIVMISFGSNDHLSNLNWSHDN